MSKQSEFEEFANSTRFSFERDASDIVRQTAVHLLKVAEEWMNKSEGFIWNRDESSSKPYDYLKQYINQEGGG